MRIQQTNHRVVPTPTSSLRGALFSSSFFGRLRLGPASNSIYGDTPDREVSSNHSLDLVQRTSTKEKTSILTFLALQSLLFACLFLSLLGSLLFRSSLRYTRAGGNSDWVSWCTVNTLKFAQHTYQLRELDRFSPGYRKTCRQRPPEGL